MSTALTNVVQDPREPAEVPYEQAGMEVLERVVIAGDLARLSPADRVAYYRAVCRSTGLNPLTKPFDYITLNGRLTLYATKTATDQLRAIKSISIDGRERDLSDPEFATWLVTGHDATGRIDTEIGSVSITGLKGEAKANAIMKALTKAKRRLTLSLAGLGWLDEIEVGSVPSAAAVNVDPETGEIMGLPARTGPVPLAEKVAASRKAITARATDAPQSAAEPTVDGPVAQVSSAVTEPPSAAVASPAVEPSGLEEAPAGVDPDVRPCGRPDPTDEETCVLPMGHAGAHEGPLRPALGHGSRWK